LLNFEFRYDPMRELLRSLVAEGAVGVPEHVSWTQFSSGSRVPLRPHGWLFERAKGGGWIGAWGSHAIDTLRFVFGEVVSARAECRTTITQRPDRDGVMQSCDAEDAFTAVLELDGGVSVSIDTSFAASSSVAPRLVVTGSEGMIECVADARIVVRRADGTRDEHTRQESDADPHLVPMRRFAVVVRDALEAGETPPGTPTFADGLAAARVMDALRG
jgi:predicted dehydrogenase